MSTAIELLGNALVASQFQVVFYLLSALILLGAGLAAWSARTWLREFDADDLHVASRGPKPKLCPTINTKLDKIERHKQTMLWSAAA